MHALRLHEPKAYLDVHLCVTQPAQYLEELAKAGKVETSTSCDFTRFEFLEQQPIVNKNHTHQKKMGRVLLDFFKQHKSYDTKKKIALQKLPMTKVALSFHQK